MTRLVWDHEVEKIYYPGVDRPQVFDVFYEGRHTREDWTETDEQLAIWDEEENGHVMFPPGGKHRKD